MLDNLYSGADLPPGFSLPKSFLVLMAQDPISDFEPWWFLNEVPDEPRYWLHRFKRDYPERVLVPFAKFGVESDFACFDGSDSSGDPVVHIVHAGATPGWEDRGKVANFDAWIELAKIESDDWKAEREDESD